MEDDKNKEEGVFVKEEQHEIMESLPKDPEYKGEAVKKDNSGLFGFLKTKKEETFDVDGIEVLSEESEEEVKEEEVKEEVKKEEVKQEVKNQSGGFLTTLFGTGNVDCDKLFKDMRECVKDKDGTTLCHKEIEMWEKHCDKKDDEEKKDDKDDNEE